MSASERGTEAKPFEICWLLGVPGGRNRRKSMELDTCWKVPAAANYYGVCGAQIDCASDQSRFDPSISRNAAAGRKALESVLWCSVFITSYHSKAQSRAPNPPYSPPRPPAHRRESYFVIVLCLWCHSRRVVNHALLNKLSGSHSVGSDVLLSFSKHSGIKYVCVCMCVCSLCPTCVHPLP